MRAQHLHSHSTCIFHSDYRKDLFRLYGPEFASLSASREYEKGQSGDVPDLVECHTGLYVYNFAEREVPFITGLSLTEYNVENKEPAMALSYWQYQTRYLTKKYPCLFLHPSNSWYSFSIQRCESVDTSHDVKFG